MALVTVSDLKTYMDISFSNRQEDAAQFVIDGLQSELETYLRRPIEIASFVETQVFLTMRTLQQILTLQELSPTAHHLQQFI